MTLTETERFKVRELRNDAVFMGIVQRIVDDHRIPHFNPKKDAMAGEQYEDWVYASGLVRGIQLFSQALGYTDDR